jgi:hypothetical protein
MRVHAVYVAVLASLVSSSAFAASYQQIDGTIIDPIQSVCDITKCGFSSDRETVVNDF